MALNSQQQAVVENRGGELLVAAAAGSGKTSVLVERLLQRVIPEDGADITDFVVITFTKEAAGELKQRIAQELNRRLAQDCQNRHLRRQLTLIYQAKISTIHSFCSQLIREHGHLIEITPSFTQCSDGESFLLRNTVVDQVINKWYEKEDNETFYGLVNLLAAGNDDKALQKILLDIHGKVQSHADPVVWLKEQQKLWENLDNLALEQTEWGQLILNFFLKQVNLARKELEFVIELSKEDENLYQNYGIGTEEVLLQFGALADLVQEVLEGKGTWDQVVDRVGKLTFPRAGTKKSKEIDPELKELVKNQRGTSYDRVRKFTLGGTSEEEEKNLRSVQKQVLTLLDLVLDFSLRYQLEKELRNQLDYNDLEHYAVKLLVHPDGSPTELAKTMGKQVVEIMVDEYQDTNQVQNAIFTALTEQGRKLFLVGDMKQAIYRFRLADPSIFTGKFKDFHPESAENPAKEGQARALTLENNYRSREEVLYSCNDFFSDVMSYDFGEVNYRKDGMLVAGATFPPHSDGYYDTELNVIDLEGYLQDNQVDSYLLEARWIAKKIRQMMDDKFQVSTGARDGLRDVNYSDFMLLLRSKNALRAHYMLALAEQNIPLYLKEGQNIFETIEVDVALSLLKTLDNPRQDVALLSLLRSPLFGFSPDDLALLRRRRSGCFYEVMAKAELEESEDSFYQDAMAQALKKRDAFFLFLQKNREKVGENSASDLLWKLYEETNMLGIYGALSAGSQRKENLLEFYQLLSAMGSPSLFACLQQLEKLAEGGKLPPTANNQREGEAVVLHSIHSSKGLEKPVVIIGGLSKKFNLQDLQKPVLFHQNYGIGPTDFDPDRQMKYSTIAKEAIKFKVKEETVSEELRLLYVAMTRAKEKLILTTVLKKGRKELESLFKGVTKPLNPSFLMEKKSLAEVILSYFLTRTEEGIHLYRWADSSSSGAISVDGNFAPSNTSRWNLNLVDYSGVETNVIPDFDLPEEEDFSQLEEDCKAWFDWEYPYGTAVETPSKLTATQVKKWKLEEVSLETEEKEQEKIHEPKRIPSFAVGTHGLTAAQRGTAIHLMMEYLEISADLDCSFENISKMKDSLLAERKLTRAQYEVMSAQQIIRFLESSWGVAARNSSSCQQEFKFSMLVSGRDLGHDTEEKILLQGVVDCWYVREDGNIVLIDFKSDQIKSADLQQKALAHQEQMETYCLALERMTGRKVAEKLLWFFDVDQGVLVP